MFTEDIKVLLAKKSMSFSGLARLLGESPQNYHTKIKRNSIKDVDLAEIGKALDLEIEIVYKDSKTGKEIYKSKL
jgi:hypothetical protein